LSIMPHGVFRESLALRLNRANSIRLSTHVSKKRVIRHCDKPGIFMQPLIR